MPDVHNRRFDAWLRACVPMAALFAAGCTLGPDLTPPQPPVNAGYSPQPLPQTTQSAMIAGGDAQHLIEGMDIPGVWWTLFRSPGLDALIRRALAGNPTVEVAQANLRQARELALAGRGALYPSLGIGLNEQGQQISGASFGQPNLNAVFAITTASVNVSYVPDIWGGIHRQIESLNAQAEYQRFELEATYLSLTSNIVAAAVQEASLRAQIAATQDIIAVESQELEGLQRQFSVGAIANTSVLAQTANLAQVQAQLPPLQKQLAQTRNQLTALLGRLPNEEPAETFDLDTLHLPDMLPVSLPSKLVEQRPDIRAAEAQLHEASANIGVAVANQFPQVNLTGSLGAESAGVPFAANSEIWSLTAGLAQPIFQGGKLQHQERAAEAAYDAAAAQYRNIVVTAFQNVADVLRALESDAESVNAQANADKAAADSLEAARRQFMIGATTYISLLNAEQVYQQTHIALVQALATRFADTAALFQALGGGWWNREDPAVVAESEKD
ncbi:MAG TPA: efflux transporter outer membrane subunit [Micropepsaceae bacterium]|nr:efflux transporter outer membrane subunit [Micropepsaceae bacterium]